MFRLGLSIYKWIVIAVIAALVIITTIMFATGTWQRLTADWRGETKQTEQIQANADYRIAKYNWFFDQCAAVQTKEAELEAARTELEGDPSDFRKQQLNANITAITSARAELINDYNAEAQKEDTAANFHASELPHQLDINDEETTCTP